MPRFIQYIQRKEIRLSQLLSKLSPDLAAREKVTVVLGSVLVPGIVEPEDTQLETIGISAGDGLRPGLWQGESDHGTV